MKKEAIISTLLDRHLAVLDGVLAYHKMEIISPDLFASSHMPLATFHEVNVINIESTLDESDYEDIENEAKKLIHLYQKNSKSIEPWLIENQGSVACISTIENVLKERLSYIIKIIKGLNKLNNEYDIKAVIVNQEYMKSEATLIQWAKTNNIPSIHFCHSPYIARNLGSIRHFLSDHLTLASERCKETLDDLNTGKGERHITGMINWDTYRDIKNTDKKDIIDSLEIPEDSLIVSFFTTYAVLENATSDIETHQKSIDAFMEAAAFINKNSNKKVFFIIKDRPSGTYFSKQNVLKKAEKLGLSNNFAYIFERPERIILISDIVISSGSSISVESMALGKATIELVSRQVFLGGLIFSAEDGVIQCEASTLKDELLTLVEKPKYREHLEHQGYINDYFNEMTKQCLATQNSAHTLLKTIGKNEESQKLLADTDFYSKINIKATDSRFNKRDNFLIWRARTQINPLTGQLMGESYNSWATKPTFHLIIIAYQHLFSALADTLDSLEQQFYPHFGVSIISPSPCPIIELNKKENIEWIQRETPEKNINEIINNVESDWVIQITPGDNVQPQALFNLADYANLNPKWLAIYGDETILRERNSDEQLGDEESHFDDSLQVTPLFKPDFNIDLFRATDYISRFIAFKRSAIKELGGFQPLPYRAAEDLIFRLHDSKDENCIGHIPQILLYRSKHIDSFKNFKENEILGFNIRNEHLKRIGYQDSKVLPGLYSSIYNIRYFSDTPKASVDMLIPSKELDEQLLKSLSTLQEQGKSGWPDNIIIATCASSHEVKQWVDTNKIEKLPINSITISDWNGPVDALQHSLSLSDSEYLILASSELRWVQENWLSPLLDQLQRPEVAAAAPRLVSSQAEIISAGQILGKDGLLGDLYRNFFLEQELDVLPRAWCEQSLNSLNPNCIAIKREVIDKLNGFNLNYKGLLAINHLQLESRVLAQKLIWTPLSTVVQIENSNYINQASIDEKKYFKQNWFKALINDPCFNKNLELKNSGLEPDTILSSSWHPTYLQRPRILKIMYNINKYQRSDFEEIEKVIALVEQSEKVQTMSYLYDDNHQKQKISSIEIARTMPSLCLYAGEVPSDESIIQDIASYTEVKQWAFIRNKKELNYWHQSMKYLTGIITDNQALLESEKNNPDSLFVFFDKTKTNYSKCRWLEDEILNILP
ncbi:hypothetical protein BFW38_12155 [Terasakiispira papahanaumokuakeensis]|uniref:Glycosyltransferase 2-like domain-containing protein n=1 Tax=Terasakiispira papahanaumokuakeensis TaxID=197479 RepID=A0A1E2VB01_9GAMM|nr:hypothetical protein [Terasakiispira papahanaumokuakeensis]ODC04167.1 hypothetical protein BFW38_12155 [Terasakiispira papahanaumokuakeensis]